MSEEPRRGDETRVDRSPDVPAHDPLAEPRPGGASPAGGTDDTNVGDERTDVYRDQRPATERTVTYEEQPPVTDQADADRSIDRDPSSEREAPSAGPGASTDWSSHGGLLPDDDLGSYQQRWDDVQVRFIDEPRQSVREADDLVGEITSRIAERFTGARQDLEQRWERGNEPTTEELRQALQRYRDFFQRLVAR